MLFYKHALATSSRGADSTDQPELAAARTRYEAGGSGVTKPLRDKYVQELHQLKSRAMTAKNLELALAVDRELKTLGVSTTGTATSAYDQTYSRKRLTQLLPGTTWVAQQPGAAYPSFTFNSEKTFTRQPLRGGTMTSPYQIARDGDTLSFTKSDGTTSTLKFSPDQSQFEMEGVTYRQKTR